MGLRGAGDGAGGEEGLAGGVRKGQQREGKE